MATTIARAFAERIAAEIPSHLVQRIPASNGWADAVGIEASVPQNIIAEMRQKAIQTHDDGGLDDDPTRISRILRLRV